MSDIFVFLDQHSIGYEQYEHQAVFTVEEADQFVPELSAAKTKNLFLRDKKGKNHFLVTLDAHKPINLKSLSKTLGVNSLSFGSPDRLMRHLGIEPGSVSLLAVINDPGHEVQVIIDEDLWGADSVQCHPLVNTQTLVLAREMLERFFAATGHSIKVVSIL